MDPVHHIAAQQAGLYSRPQDEDTFYETHSFERLHRVLGRMQRLLASRPRRAKIVPRPVHG